MLLQIFGIKGWTPLELISHVRPFALKRTSSTGELFQCFRRQDLGPVMHSGSIMSFVDWSSGVYNLWSNGFFLDYWLDMLVHVVMNSFTRKDRRFSCGFVRGIVDNRRVLIFGGITVEI